MSVSTGWSDTHEAYHCDSTESGPSGNSDAIYFTPKEERFGRRERSTTLLCVRRLRDSVLLHQTPWHATVRCASRCRGRAAPPFPHSRFNRINLRRQYFHATPAAAKTELLQIARSLLQFVDYPDVEQFRSSEKIRAHGITEVRSVTAKLVATAPGDGGGLVSAGAEGSRLDLVDGGVHVGEVPHLGELAVVDPVEREFADGDFASCCGDSGRGAVMGAGDVESEYDQITVDGDVA